MLLRSGVLVLLLVALSAGVAPPAGVQAAQGVPPHVVPFERPEFWPHSVSSARVVVHYQQADDEAMADQVLAALEYAWLIQIDVQGSLAPLDDHGLAGPDGRFDSYLWRGIDTMYVDSVAPEASTPYDDHATFMVLDPWGQYGGPELEANLFHELRHASQAVDDWWEDYPIFEAEATLWEATYFGTARLADPWADFQARPDWTLLRDDGYRTWYMYGGALFFLHLTHHVFGGSLDFANEMWHASRNPPGAEFDPLLNEPDFVDALEAILAAQGTSFEEQAIAFARSRYYTGRRADGVIHGAEHIAEIIATTQRLGRRTTSIRVAPMMLGTSYVEVHNTRSEAQPLHLSLGGDAGARFVVQAVGLGDADQIFDASGDTVTLPPSGSLTFAITALPSDEPFDPDEVTDARFKATLTLRP